MVVFVLHYPTRTTADLGRVPDSRSGCWPRCNCLQDIQGSLDRENAGNVAYTAHLAGAAFAFLFYRTGWQLGSFLPRGSRWAACGANRGYGSTKRQDDEDDLGEPRRSDPRKDQPRRSGQPHQGRTPHAGKGQPAVSAEAAVRIQRIVSARHCQFICRYDPLLNVAARRAAIVLQ